MSSATKMPWAKPRWASCRPGHDVAHGVHAVDRGAAALVGDDEAAVEGDPGLLVAQAVGDRAATDGDQQQVGDELVAALEAHRDGRPVVLGRLEPHAGAEGDAALAERPLQRGADRGVLGGDEPGEGLDDGDLGAERAHHRRELDADDAAAEHDDTAGHGIQRQGTVAGDDRATDLEAGQGAGVGAGGEHDVPADEPPVADDDGAVALEATGALDVVDLAGLHQALQALVQPAHHALAVGRDGRQVDAVERGPHTEPGGLAGGVGDLGRVQQRLGGDAAPVQAGAAEEVLLDEGDAQAELGGAQRAGVAAAPAPEDDDVMGGLGGGRHPWLLPCCGGSWAPATGWAVRTLPSILSLPTRRTHRAPTPEPRGSSRSPRSTPYRVRMAWWRRGHAKQAPHGGGDLASARAHFEDFIGTRRGVEAYVEPATNITATTVVLIAHDGEWTRRALPSRPVAFDVARSFDIPVYDVNLTGYPARMRQWTSRQRKPKGR